MAAILLITIHVFLFYEKMKAGYIHVLEMCVIYLHERHTHKLKCRSGQKKFLFVSQFLH